MPKARDDAYDEKLNALAAQQRRLGEYTRATERAKRLTTGKLREELAAAKKRSD